MPVGNFWINGDRATSVYTGINVANLTKSFLRRDGSNTTIGAIDINSNIIKNVADPLSNQEVASNNYVDTNAFTTADGRCCVWWYKTKCWFSVDKESRM